MKTKIPSSNKSKLMASRAFFMEPCPSCNRLGTYGSHADRGYTTCQGCEDNFCNECFVGCRYTCKYFQDTLHLPLPPKLERQLTESKWESAEEHMQQHPEKTETFVARIHHHIYKVLRRGDSLLRIHGDEACVACGHSDIRYPEHHAIYKTRGFMCAKCISSS